MRLASRVVSVTFVLVVMPVLLYLGGRTHGVPAMVLLALALSFGVAWVAARLIGLPLVRLARAAVDLAAGTAGKVPHSEIPELRQLSEAIRRMHTELASRDLQLHNERAGGNAIVDAMVEGVLATAPQGRIVMANPAARRLLGIPPRGALPDLRVLFRARGARDAVADVLEGREVHDCEVDLDGRILIMNARPLPDKGAVLVMHDVTDVRRLEAVRRDFVANVSHELKTPLTSIAGYADTLADPGIDAETRQRFLRTIVANTGRMQRLVDDLLDLSRIESGRWIPKIQHILLGPLIDETWEAFGERAAERQVQFERQLAADALHADVDPDAFRQILGNLFDNALRYVPVAGRIVCRSERANGGVAISVEDNGAGIPGEHLSRIFERFYRVDPARARAEGGTGLGLAIVRHMVEAHSGSVAATSELQQGMTVRCWFPDAPAATPPVTTADDE